MKIKCNVCGRGEQYEVEWGEYPGQTDVRCTFEPCDLNVWADDAAQDRWQDYFMETWEDDQGERHYY